MKLPTTLHSGIKMNGAPGNDGTQTANWKGDVGEQRVAMASSLQLEMNQACVAYAAFPRC